jgi:ABC-type molybdate transport system substrate-binding protein
VNTFWKNRLFILLSLLVVVPLSACGGSSSGGPGGQRDAPDSILVLADSSLKDAFTQLAQQIHSANPSRTVHFTFGPSKAMAQKANAGDPGDVLAVAGVQNMNSAQKAQLGNPVTFATKGSVTYQIVTLNQTKNSSLATQFINVVTSDPGQQVLSQAGFSGP